MDIWEKLLLTGFTVCATLLVIFIVLHFAAGEVITPMIEYLVLETFK